ncbi:hypothetical protein FVA81_12535 [Rhizobium sp. WL3]|uniref:glucosamine inositolphosphorylceramide transferase family protein n=1 Tax=Rhizobium sp. WL3 TaxID=2603277 RepID=UPI0011C20591|nr:hypothetical protein [Rhizobium sp. WL3]QEE45381.1 hypothetical protein FVA81_12535 [Rhizobium sp. WL3]
MDASAASTARTTAQSSMAPLRIGLLTDRRDGLENWQRALIDRLLADDRFRLQAIIVCPAKPGAAPAAFRLAAALERRTLGRQPVYRPKDPGFAELAFNTLDELVARGEGKGLDLVLAISPLSLPQDAFSSLPFGSWHFSFLDEANADADWYGYEEVIAGKPSTNLCITVRQAGKRDDEMLAEAEFNTKFSAVRNSDFIKERAVTLVMRELRKLTTTRILTTLPSPATRPPLQPPGLGKLLPYAARVGRNLLARGRQAVEEKLGIGAAPWVLFVGDGRPEDFDPRTAVLLKPDDDELRADPFLFPHDGETYVFYEAYTPRNTKAHISVGKLVGDRLERLGIALKAEHHLSYPFIFRHDDGIFMIPETNKARRLEVWRCVEFPLRWELHASALEGQSSADSALFPFRGKWWLFTNLSEFHAYEDHCSELHIFEVDGPDLKWMKPHRNNPVVMGSTEARNAGRPFEYAGRLYRPSQRNEHGIYGYGLNIMEVEELDLHAYRERCVRTIEPDFYPGIVACHHMDALGGRYIIDAMFADQADLLR